MFGSTQSQKENFIEKKKAAREERALEKRREEAAVIIQSYIRRYLQIKRYHRRIVTDLDQLIGFGSDNSNRNGNANIQLNTSTVAYPIIRRYIGRYEFIIDYEGSFERFEQLCRYLNKAMEVDVPKSSYVLLCLQKDKSLPWIAHIKSFLLIILRKIDELKPENHINSTSLALYLHTLVVFTSTKSWAILRNKKLDSVQAAMQKFCINIQGHLVQNGFYTVMRNVLLKGSPREELTLKSLSLTAIITLCMRPLIDSEFSRHILVKFLVEIFSVPALVFHLKKYIPQCFEIFTNTRLLEHTLNITGHENCFNEECVGAYMPATKCLALLGNIINLFALETPTNVAGLAYPMFTKTVYQLFELIPNTVSTKGVFSQWHEMLGWHTPSKDSAQNQNVPLIKKQFHMLWTSRCLMMLFGEKLQEINANYERVNFQPPVQPSTSSILRKALERSTPRNNLNKPSSKTIWRKFNSPEVLHISRVCAMYYSGLNSLSQLKMEILTGVCYTGTILYNLWLFITSLGPYCGLKEFLELFKTPDYLRAAPTSMLMLFCDCMTHYVTILDEHEMYTEQKPFQLNDYVLLTYFLNNILYKIVTDVVIDNSKIISQSPLFISLHTLLLCLYRRDSRRKFTPNDHWIIPEVKPNTFLNDLDKGKRYAVILLQKMPHIIPHEDRVKLFRKFVQNEKVALGVTESVFATPRSSLIIVHRDRLVEDGYRQLAALKPQELKGVIRVRFVNQQGLHEAGIDQDGVFKEFLEETIKKVFDPALNLFKTTSDQRLYPSPISYVQDNHLQLFEFIGRMLGKAVYEGIVVDVPFATFFLSQLLGQSQQALYSCIDELSSLDVELYRSLTIIKHYKDDVADLNLTFSVDQDVMGKIITHELHPGGKGREVNNFNKLVYVHYMAYFHMNTQIRDQTQAFNRGFRSIVNPEWLSLFSTPELQRLISGDTAPLDFKDLRKNTQYYGGFHDSHRVICWLWEILAKDFTEEEKRLFLKFVTSCSKPPLLGFAHLEPPFSIRCVEVGDDEDIGDTIGSVIRGFFTIYKRDPLNRLPTSSTCFNLLKLPNYQKKSTLRDKLRYAITSNTGFELS